MKKILIAGLALFTSCLIQAQQKEGRVIYERTVQIQISFGGGGPVEGMEQMIPRSRTDKFELSFGNNRSLWRQAVPDNSDENTFGGEGVQVRVVMPGLNDVLYTDLETKRRVEHREMFDKKFIIDDSIRPLKWKMTGETKLILNHTCMKATAEQISTRQQMTMSDGKMERKSVTDTALVVAWFAMDIPVSAGPAEFQGQLPGLVLEMDIANGRQVFKATSLSEKADLAIIKEPTGKKRYTQEEFSKEREKIMEEMQRNNNMGGNRRSIRIN